MLNASGKVQEKARRIAASMLEAAFEDVELSDGRYQVKGVPAKSLALAAIAERAYGEALAPGLEPGLEATDYFRPPNLVYPFGAHVAVVEVDRDTGRRGGPGILLGGRLRRPHQPLLVEGQVHGGIAQGVAQALLEEVVYDADGQLVTGSLMDYALPRAEDLPSFTTDQTVTVTPRNPLGAKGIGEAATIGSTPPWSMPWWTPCARSACATSTCRSAPSACGGRSARSADSLMTWGEESELRGFEAGRSWARTPPPPCNAARWRVQQPSRGLEAGTTTN